MAPLASRSIAPGASLNSPEVTIVAGSGKAVREFVVHQRILCHYSTYFAGAFRNDIFEEVLSRRFVFSDITPAVVTPFHNWAYFGVLADPQPIVDANSSKWRDRTSVALGCRELTEIWIFGDRMGIPELQNKAIDQLYQQNVECHGQQEGSAQLVYSNTLPKSALRRYLVDQQVYLNLLSEAKRTELSKCGDFVLHICLRCAEIRATSTSQPNASKRWNVWSKLDMSQYHVHTSRNRSRVSTE